MLSKNWKLILLSSVGLAFVLGNSAVFAQTSDVVVPTVPSGSSTTYPNPYPNPYPPNTPTNIPVSTTGDGNTRFSCQNMNGQYVVMYQPQSQPGQYFSWAAPRDLGGGWRSERRCAEIARRLETYRPDGLQELQVSVENNENIVCVTTDTNQRCRIVLTIPRGQDPYTVRNNVFQNLVTADNGQQTVAVNTFRGGSDDIYNLGRTALGNGNNRVSTSRTGINLKPYLDPRDGGTASNMRNGVAIRNQSPNPVRTRLNPDKFR